MMNQDTLELICVGELSAAHGIKGYMKLRSFTEVAEDVFDYNPLYTKDGGIIEIEQKGMLNNNAFVVQVKGITNRNEAEFIKGTEIFIDKSQLPDLEEGGFYYNDLIGLDVKDSKTGNVLGKIKYIHDFGAGDLVEIDFNQKRDLETFPFTEEIFPEINLNEGYVAFNEPEFLLGKSK